MTILLPYCRVLLHIVLCVAILPSLVVGAPYEAKCSHSIGPDDGNAYCNQPTTYIPSTETQHSSCASRACSSYSSSYCGSYWGRRYCRWCSRWVAGGCNAWNGACTSYTYWSTSDNNAYYAYQNPKSWNTITCDSSWQDGGGTYTSIWDPFACTTRKWASGKCQSAGTFKPVVITYTASSTPSCGTCPSGKYSAPNYFGKTPPTTVTEPPDWDNCKTWKAVSLLNPNHNINAGQCTVIPSSQSFQSVSIAGKTLCCPPNYVKNSDGSKCTKSGEAPCFLYSTAAHNLNGDCPKPCGSVMDATDVTSFSCGQGSNSEMHTLNSKGLASSTASVGNTFKLPSSANDVPASVNGVYRFRDPRGGTDDPRSLYIFDTSPIWSGGDTWMSNTANHASGSSSVRCRTSDGIDAYSDPMPSSRRGSTSDTWNVIGGQDWTLLSKGKVSYETPSPPVDATTVLDKTLPGHPCTTGLYDRDSVGADGVYIFQQMHTCVALRTDVPGKSTPVRGNQCTKWRHTSHGSEGSTVDINLKTGSNPSPFGLYKVTPRANKGTSEYTATPALYIWDELGWEQGCTYCWNTKSRDKKTYPMCSTDGKSWKTLWNVGSKGNNLLDNAPLVGDHYGGHAGWILLHNGATYPTQVGGGPAHPCPVDGHHTTSKGGLTEIWACDEIQQAPYVDERCSEHWCKTCSGDCNYGCWPGCEGTPKCAKYDACKLKATTDRGDAICTACPAGYIQPTAGEATCISCPAGWHSTVDGGTACEACPAGQARGLGTPLTEACTVCLPGFAAPSAGLAKCELCIRGTYSEGPVAGMYDCQVCPAGQYQEQEKKSACVLCDAGRFLSHKFKNNGGEDLVEAAREHDQWGDCKYCDYTLGLKETEDRAKCDYCKVGEYALTIDENGQQLPLPVCVPCGVSFFCCCLVLVLMVLLVLLFQYFCYQCLFFWLN